MVKKVRSRRRARGRLVVLRQILVDRRRLIYSFGTALLAASILVGWSVATARVDAYVHGLVQSRFDPEVDFVDLPQQLEGLASVDLITRATAAIEGADWTSNHICREVAEGLQSLGWIAGVNHVRRTSDARFEVSCRYRLPTAMVQMDGEFYLVDDDGVRLPGEYLYNAAWPLVQGAAASPPQPGMLWPGQDVHAGLSVLQSLRSEPFSRQITAVLVGNHDGRSDPLAEHIELATDRAGGRIRWGSAPGRELEENTVAQKIAIMRENYRRTGRADAKHPIISISTLPDRFSIPG